VSLVPGGNFAARFTPLKICCAIQQEAVRKIFEPLTMTGPASRASAGWRRGGRSRRTRRPSPTSYAAVSVERRSTADGQDVAFTYRLALTKAVASGTFVRSRVLGLRGGKDFYDGKSNEIPGIQVLDDYTIRLVLEKPNVEFARVTEAGIVPSMCSRTWFRVRSTNIPSPRNRRSVAAPTSSYSTLLTSSSSSKPTLTSIWARRGSKAVHPAAPAQVAIAQLEKGESTSWPSSHRSRRSA